MVSVPEKEANHKTKIKYQSHQELRNRNTDRNLNESLIPLKERSFCSPEALTQGGVSKETVPLTVDTDRNLKPLKERGYPSSFCVRCYLSFVSVLSVPAGSVVSVLPVPSKYGFEDIVALRAFADVDLGKELF